MTGPKSTLSIPAGASRSRSRDTDRPGLSRNSTTASAARYLPQGAEGLLPEGTISEEGLDLLQNFTHTGHVHEETLVEEPPTPSAAEAIELGRKEMNARPWYRRPSPWW